MKVTFEIEDEEKFGDLMSATFVGGCGTEKVNVATSGFPLNRRDRAYRLNKNGEFEEVE